MWMAMAIILMHNFIPHPHVHIGEHHVQECQISDHLELQEQLEHQCCAHDAPEHGHCSFLVDLLKQYDGLTSLVFEPNATFERILESGLPVAFPVHENFQLKERYLSCLALRAPPVHS